MFDWLGVVVSPMNHVLFVIGAGYVTWAELLGFLTGGACVWLTVRASVLNFPMGIANSAFFLILFTYAALWADAALQILFIALGVLGWWRWVHPGRAQVVATRWASTRVVLACLAFVVVATPVLAIVLSATHDSAPFWDALTTSLSLAAQWLLNAQARADLVVLDRGGRRLHSPLCVQAPDTDGADLRGFPGYERARAAGLESRGVGRAPPDRARVGSAMNRHGLVMGKFYPPHIGHHDLIRRAATECDRVSVVVVGASVESIALTDRLTWLRDEPGMSGYCSPGTSTSASTWPCGPWIRFCAYA